MALLLSEKQSPELSDKSYGTPLYLTTGSVAVVTVIRSHMGAWRSNQPLVLIIYHKLNLPLNGNAEYVSAILEYIPFQETEGFKLWMVFNISNGCQKIVKLGNFL